VQIVQCQGPAISGPLRGAYSGISFLLFCFAIQKVVKSTEIYTILYTYSLNSCASVKRGWMTKLLTVVCKSVLKIFLVWNRRGPTIEALHKPPPKPCCATATTKRYTSGGGGNRPVGTEFAPVECISDDRRRSVLAGFFPGESDVAGGHVAGLQVGRRTWRTWITGDPSATCRTARRRRQRYWRTRRGRPRQLWYDDHTDSEWTKKSNGIHQLTVMLDSAFPRYKLQPLGPRNHSFGGSSQCLHKFLEATSPQMLL